MLPLWPDPRFPDWVSPVLVPPPELVWPPIVATVVFIGTLLLLAAVLSSRGASKARSVLAFVLAECVAMSCGAATAVLTLRHPPSPMVFEGLPAAGQVVVVVSPQAPRRDLTGRVALDFSEHCALLLHPDDHALLERRGPWTIYQGLFPLPVVDHASIGDTWAVAFDVAEGGPTPLQGAAVHGAISRCGGDAVAAAWTPPLLTVKNGADLLVFQRRHTDPTEGPWQVDRSRSCGAVIPDVDLSRLRVDFVDADATLHGLAGVDITHVEDWAVGWLRALSSDLPPERVVEELVMFDEVLVACLESDPDLARAVGWGLSGLEQPGAAATDDPELVGGPGDSDVE